MALVMPQGTTRQDWNRHKKNSSQRPQQQKHRRQSGNVSWGSYGEVPFHHADSI